MTDIPAPAGTPFFRRRPMRRSGTALLVALCLSASACPEAFAQSPADIFRQAFGNRKAPAVQRLDLPVALDGREIGAVPGAVGPNPDAASVDAAALADLLTPLLSAEAVARIREAGSGSGTADGLVPVGELSQEGLAVGFDPGLLALAIEAAPRLKRRTVLDFAPQPDDYAEDIVVHPAFLSAYVNLRATQSWSDTDGSEARKGRQPLAAGIDGAVNLDGWVIEGEATYREDAQPRWRRGDFRLVRDLPGERLRISAGDIGFPVAGFQTGRPLGGVAIARNFLLDPYETFTPGGRREFILTEPSVVEVEVNGRPTRTFRLGPGPYDLMNFPGTAGTNDVRIRITDQTGREEVIAFPFFFDARLLAPGIHEFAYAVGMPSSFTPEGYSYSEGDFTITGLHRFGVTDRLTLGANLQAEPDHRVVGAELLLATSAGTFGFEPSLSHLDGFGTGLAAALRYRDFRDDGEIWQRRTVTAQALWRGDGFVPLGLSEPRNPIALDLSARLGQPVTTDATLTFGTRYQAGRAGTGDAYSLEAGLRTRLGRGLYFDISAERLRNQDGGRETIGFASLRMILGDGRTSASADHDTRSGESRLQWRYQDFDPIDALSGGVELIRGKEGDAVAGDIGYVHQRFTAAARHERVERLAGREGGGTADGIDRFSSVTLATAFAFADGMVGMSRPIADSFAIVAPHKRIRDRRIEVDPVEGRYAAGNGLLGPALVPNLSSYRQRPILIDVPDAPPGYDLGEDRPVLRPTYRSGIVVPVGTDGVAGIGGILAGADGMPLALQAGVLRPPGGGAEQPFFTNRSGRFRIEGVAPGDWEIVLTTMEGRIVTVSVPDDAEGVIDLGIVVP